MSAPAAKAFVPEPVMMMTRAEGCCRSRYKHADASSSMTLLLRAFKVSGRLMVMVAMPVSSSTSTKIEVKLSCRAIHMMVASSTAEDEKCLP